MKWSWTADYGMAIKDYNFRIGLGLVLLLGLIEIFLKSKIYDRWDGFGMDAWNHGSMRGMDGWMVGGSFKMVKMLNQCLCKMDRMWKMDKMR